MFLTYTIADIQFLHFYFLSCHHKLTNKKDFANMLMFFTTHLYYSTLSKTFTLMRDFPKVARPEGFAGPHPKKCVVKHHLRASHFWPRQFNHIQIRIVNLLELIS